MRDKKQIILLDESLEFFMAAEHEAGSDKVFFIKIKYNLNEQIVINHHWPWHQ